MGIENPVHLLFLAAVALVVLGPRRLPELARAAGKGMREFREALNGEGEEDASGVAARSPSDVAATQATAQVQPAQLSPPAGEAQVATKGHAAGAAPSPDRP
jgi:sec-independent protein translocase protein TatA